MGLLQTSLQQPLYRVTLRIFVMAFIEQEVQVSYRKQTHQALFVRHEAPVLFHIFQT